MFLEHLAMYNGADMYKYLYTYKLDQHVLTPEAYLFYVTKLISDACNKLSKYIILRLYRPTHLR